MTLALLVVALLLLVYLPVIHGQEVMDDRSAILEDSRWVNKNWKGLYQIDYIKLKKLWIPFYRPIYRALTYLTWLPCRSLEALHFGNVLIQGAGVVVVYFLAAALGYDPLLAALVFAVHPLATEAVANNCRRSSLLSGVLWGLTALCVATGHYYLAVISFGLALFAKEDAPGIFGAAIQQLYVKRDVGNKKMEAAGLDVSLPQPAYTITSIVAHAKAIPAWFWGLDQNVDHHVKEPTTGGLIYTTIVLGLLFTLAPTPILLLLFLSPLVGYFFVPIQDILVEHRAYTLTFIFALLWSDVLSSLPVWVTVIMVAWFGAMAAWRSFGFSTPLRFWFSAYRDGSAKKLRVLLMLASSHQLRGDIETATRYNREVLETYPRQGIAIANIALSHIMKAQLSFTTGKPKEGIDNVREAWRLVQEAKGYCPEDASVETCYKQIEGIKNQVEAQVEAQKVS